MAGEVLGCCVGLVLFGQARKKFSAAETLLSIEYDFLFQNVSWNHF
jgi:hypothetical protein